MRNALPFLALTLLGITACERKAGLTAKDLHGTWAQGIEHGYVLEFDSKSDKFLVHGPGSGGHDSHDHFAGRYQCDGEQFVLTGTWESDNKAETTRGTLRDGKLQVPLQGKTIDLQRK